MTTLNLILLSGSIGGAMGATVFFAKDEPYKIEIVIASVIRNILVGILIAQSITLKFIFAEPTLPVSLGYGTLYGFLSILVVFFLKGEINLKRIYRLSYSAHLPVLLLVWLCILWEHRYAAGHVENSKT